MILGGKPGLASPRVTRMAWARAARLRVRPDRQVRYATWAVGAWATVLWFYRYSSVLPVWPGPGRPGLGLDPTARLGIPPGRLAPGLLYYGVTGTGRARYWLVLYYY
jgi:hypothetical protein